MGAKQQPRSSASPQNISGSRYSNHNSIASTSPSSSSYGSTTGAGTPTSQQNLTSASSMSSSGGTSSYSSQGPQMKHPSKPTSHSSMHDSKINGENKGIYFIFQSSA